MRVDIWSDVVCPWCYIGKRRFEAALVRFPHREAIEVVWHSFELDPHAPAVRPGDRLEYLAAKYGTTRAEAEAMEARVTAAAAGEGVALRLDLARSGNSFDAHRLLHLAAESGLQAELKERFFRAYFTEGTPIGDRDALERLAVETGLSAAEVNAVLASDRYREAVRADERRAHEYGINGVPFFVFDGTYGISGAQAPEVFTNVLDRAWSESAESAASLPS
jgi:predicted DsbA family dithiol-disulfide isomerase